MALRWVQKYISAFGGDPTKVTLYGPFHPPSPARVCVTDFFFRNKKRWGESAGAISISLHMVASPPQEPTTTKAQAQNLYRATFMQSGSPLSLGDLTNGQRFYDDLVIETGCSGSVVDDTLACLRCVPYERIRAVFDRSPGFLDYEVSFVSRSHWFPSFFLSAHLSYFMGRIGYAVVLATSCRWKIYNG